MTISASFRPGAFRDSRIWRWLRRINDSALFDPGRIPAAEVLARTVGCLAIGTFLARRILQLQGWPGYIREVRWLQPAFARLTFLPQWLSVAPFDAERYYARFGYTKLDVDVLWSAQALLWFTETAVLLAYVLSLLTRAPARAMARGFAETVFPVLVAGVPPAIVATSYTFRAWFPERSHVHLSALLAITLALVCASGLNLLGLVALRRSYTIMSEARALVRSGIYGVVRHPIYIAHVAGCLCHTLLHLHAGTTVLFIGFVAGQALRARIEENKLAAMFPEYVEYRRMTGMFLPRRKAW